MLAKKSSSFHIPGGLLRLNIFFSSLLVLPQLDQQPSVSAATPTAAAEDHRISRGDAKTKTTDNANDLPLTHEHHQPWVSRISTTAATGVDVDGRQAQAWMALATAHLARRLDTAEGSQTKF